MRIKARNFLSWEDLDFSPGSGVTLIQGFNHDDETPEGSGKSAILNALTWCIYGKIPKEANVDDVVMEGKKSCEVEVDLGDCSVFRSRSPNDLCVKYPNGKIHRGTTAVETQKFIIKLMDMSFETFCQAVYFAQNYPNKFVTANQEGKGKIITEIQNLEQFDRGRKVAAERAKEKSLELLAGQKDVEKFQTLKQTLQDNVTSIEQDLEQFKAVKVARIQELFRQLDALETESKNFLLDFEREKKEELKEMRANLKAWEAKSSEASQELKELKTALKEADLTSLELERRNCTGYRAEHQDFVNEMKAKLGSIDIVIKAQAQRERDLKNAEKELIKTKERVQEKTTSVEGAEYELVDARKELNSAVNAMTNPDKEKCPTCGQDWNGDPAHYEKEVTKAKQAELRISKMLKGYQNDLSEAKGTRDALKEVIKLLKEEIAGFEVPDSEKFKKLMAEAQNGVDVNNERLKELDFEIIAINKLHLEVSALEDRVERGQEAVEQLKKDIAKEEARNPEKQVASFDARREQLEREIETEDAREPELQEKKLKDAKEKLKKNDSELRVSSTKVEALQTDLIRIEALRDGFREVKAYTFETILAQLTRKANQYLSQLFNQNVKIKFQNVDMKIDATVTIDGHERPLGLYSGGQFRRIALAVDLALADITLSRKDNKFNLIIMDEYFKDLSEVSMERILGILQARKTPTLLIEHNSIFKAIVDQTFELELRDGISRRI